MKNTDTSDKAIALQYHRELPAPVIIARGSGWQVDIIRREAEKAGIPVIRDPGLIQELAEFKTGSPIPESCFAVVAAIYRFLYEIQSEPLRKRHE